MQRAFNTFEIPKDIAPKSIVPNQDGVEIIWPDAHRSNYSWEWLLASTAREPLGVSLAQEDPILWDASIASQPPEVDFDDVMNPLKKTGMPSLTHKILKHGFCFVSKTPCTPEATEKLLQRIGPIRNTHYGGFYDFIPNLEKADTAYTNLALAAHTDTTYFSDPAGLQAFHMLSHTAPPDRPSTDDQLGGQSLLVDGFHVAHQLELESPQDYQTLQQVKIPWHASGNQGVAIAPDKLYPVVETSGPQLRRIRWNNDDRGVIPLDTTVEEWYGAARKWDEMLRRRENEYWFQLEPGRVLIFDNWRILHGRSAFQGTRRICGGYINRDDFISRWKTSNFSREEVIAANLHAR